MSTTKVHHQAIKPRLKIALSLGIRNNTTELKYRVKARMTLFKAVEAAIARGPEMPAP